MRKKMSKDSFEQILKKLDRILVDMESNDSTLEKNLKLFEEGVLLIEDCKNKLETAEQKVKELIIRNDGKFDLKDRE
tara:strand:- start:114579 stop:114809 length:231 start_codon:yes stop_codon:yes gene_type:complete